MLLLPGSQQTPILACRFPPSVTPAAHLADGLVELLVLLIADIPSFPQPDGFDIIQQLPLPPLLLACLLGGLISLISRCVIIIIFNIITLLLILNIT